MVTSSYNYLLSLYLSLCSLHSSPSDFESDHGAHSEQALRAVLVSSSPAVSLRAWAKWGCFQMASPHPLMSCPHSGGG